MLDDADIDLYREGRRVMMTDHDAERISQMIVDLESLADGQDDDMGYILDQAAHLIDGLTVRVRHLEEVNNNLTKENVRLMEKNLERR